MKNMHAIAFVTLQPTRNVFSFSGSPQLVFMTFLLITIYCYSTTKANQNSLCMLRFFFSGIWLSADPHLVVWCIFFFLCTEIFC